MGLSRLRHGLVFLMRFHGLRRFSRDPEGLALRLGAQGLDTLADPAHRRLQGWVESLALAAQIAVPRVMVIESSSAIEAFALGWDRRRTIMVVSRGALDRLSRQELHGLLALATSRIMTGEVRQHTAARARAPWPWPWRRRYLAPPELDIELREPRQRDVVACLLDEGARVHQKLHDTSAADDLTSRLLRAAQDTAGAASALVALMQDLCGDAHAPEWGRQWLIAGQRHPMMRELLGQVRPEVRSALRWPLIELSLARLNDLEPQTKAALLEMLSRVVSSFSPCEPRAWIDFALIARRLSEPGAVPARRTGASEAVAARQVRMICAVFSCVAEVHEVRADRTANALIRALGLDPVGGSPGELSVSAFSHALAQLARMPHADRELLVNGLAAMVSGDLSWDGREWLRLLRLVLDAPTGEPPGLAASAQPEPTDPLRPLRPHAPVGLRDKTIAPALPPLHG
jgi:hypothetical protein